MDTSSGLFAFVWPLAVMWLGNALQAAPAVRLEARAESVNGMARLTIGGKPVEPIAFFHNTDGSMRTIRGRV